LTVEFEIGPGYDGAMCSSCGHCPSGMKVAHAKVGKGKVVVNFHLCDECAESLLKKDEEPLNAAVKADEVAINVIEHHEGIKLLSYTYSTEKVVYRVHDHKKNVLCMTANGPTARAIYESAVEKMEAGE